ncbi:efflux RND transporter periplasmic adaptor subunit [Roseiconus nitratireducens]|uniref:Efflux RND transporter periplasmic adaptor subunit n=1 Tax=Roseiconus nitratireducens TaxID=2605748 RepID=A0A5M6DLU2_9BACT|nr:efflux RND transporter periplasmic adaptor subunit [Roseiconus nitratireducens]KAA5547222.1 efflux RND transporter periplasmic adaptor subunit [Roseiconus nitratireducens]
MATTLESPQSAAEPTHDISPGSATPTEPASAQDKSPPIGALLSWLPSIAVLGLLGAIGWYGHHHDWRPPTFGSMTTAATEASTPWCASHGVPEEECIVCNPGLIDPPPELTYCNEHGVHGCVLHHPELAETKQPVQPTPADLQRARDALALMPRAENMPLSSTAGARIQFASTDALVKAGVDVEPVTRASLAETIEAAGEIQYDATKTAVVSPPADGIVREVHANVGDWVHSGDVLAIVDSQELGRLKATLVSALLEEKFNQDQMARFAKLAPSGAISGKRLLQGETELQQATVAVEQAIRSLTNLGLVVDQDRLRSADLDSVKRYVRSIGTEQDAEPAAAGEDDAPRERAARNDNMIAVRAPIEGRIITRETTLGEVVDRGSRMFRIADPRTVWLDLRVPAEQASLAEIGTPVTYQADGSQQVHRGEVTWISTDVDPQTRTVRVRAELPNPSGSLRNESFGHGEIVLRQEDDTIVVPEQSLQWDGASHVVFVRDAKYFDEDRPKFFVTRSVRPGARSDGMVEILAGVLPGEVVVSDGSDVLRAQLLRSNLGAGCTCGH